MWAIRYEEANLVSRHRGTLPVIISCPHDGKKVPPEVPKRTGSNSDCPPFKTSRDLRTREITEGVAQRLLEVYGEAPYVVIAEFNRQYIDSNRPAECGFEVPAAEPFYAEYHGTLRSFVNEIRAENGGLGLLIDIHGTGLIETDPADLYLGTDNGKTVERLQKIDPQLLWRRRSLRGLLGPEAAGYIVSPKQPETPETPGVDGGYTVRTYGSSHPNGIDATQIEIAPSPREQKEKREAFIEHLASAIGNLVERYADAHTLAAFQKVTFLSGDLDQVVIGQVQRRSRATLPCLSWAANFKTAAVLTSATTRVEQATPGFLGVRVCWFSMMKMAPTYYLWVDNRGQLRISSSEAGADNQEGAIIGMQTRLRRRHIRRIRRLR